LFCKHYQYTAANAINAAAVMLTGSSDFSINGTGAVFGTVAGTRYVHVTDSSAVLNVANSFAGAQQPFNKAGAGTLNLNGAANQLNFTAVQNVNVLQGIMRGTLTSLGGGTSAGGAFTTINLYGGVLEISGGGTFSRALNVAGAAGGGGIKIDGGGSARGDGGFSAIGGDSTVTLVTAVGGTTAASPVWNAGGFVSNGYALLMGSTKADSRIDFTNNIGLDDGTAANSYFAREIRVAAGAGGDSARLSGVISGSANADLLKTGGGVLELTNTNTYAGNTLIQQGTLIATNGAAISNTSAVVLANTAGATLQVNNSETVGTLSGGGTTGGNVALQANTLTAGDQRDSTYGGVISGAGGALVKQGSGTLALTNANTYSGGTTVSAGTLQASNTSGSATGSGTVSVNGSTAVLSGTGTVSGATTVTIGQIKPGTSSSTGTLNFGSDVTLSGSTPGMRMTLRLAATSAKDGNDLATIVSHLADGTFTTWVTGQASTYEAMTAGSHDKAVIAGGFNIGAGSQISVDTLGYNPALGDVFNILDWASVTVGGFDFGGTRRAGGLVGDLSLPALDSGLAYDLSLFNATGSSGIVLVVPEPSKAGFVFVGLVALINRRRRSRK
jgi:autotransporter-associated beta strand protein